MYSIYILALMWFDLVWLENCITCSWQVSWNDLYFSTWKKKKTISSHELIFREEYTFKNEKIIL